MSVRAFETVATDVRHSKQGYGLPSRAPRSLWKDLARTGVHVTGALAIQATIKSLGGSSWTGAAAGGALFVGRELAQAEYRWIERFGRGRRAALPWWGALDPRVWDIHSVNGWAAPLIIVAMVAARSK